MKKILTSAQMKQADNNTIEQHKVPSLVLMERAALACVEQIDSAGCAVICGTGNNGADGVAIARILHQRGVEVTVYVCGPKDRYTNEMNQQIIIATSYGVCFKESLEEMPKDCDTVVDALFGIGLSREVSGEYAKAVTWINESGARILAVDMPSGYSSDTGCELGCGVHADITVTFSYIKRGQLLGKCKAEGCGQLILADVGIFNEEEKDVAYAIEHTDVVKALGKRKNDANKGSCGKLLVIAGSQDVYGACYLCVHAAMVTGTGLTKVLTHVNNTAVLKDKLPEAITIGYDTYNDIQLAQLLEWADTVLIGPGLSTNDMAHKLVCYIMTNSQIPVVADADALNILAEDTSLLKNAKCPVIITPHMAEMSRLNRMSIADINSDMVKAAADFSRENNCITVLKNHCTVVSDGNDTYINTTGNAGMATGGSGDVLSGIIATLVAQKMDPVMAAAIGVNVHGAAGDVAADANGMRGMLASDIITGIKQILK